MTFTLFALFTCICLHIKHSCAHMFDRISVKMMSFYKSNILDEIAFCDWWLAFLNKLHPHTFIRIQIEISWNSCPEPSFLRTELNIESRKVFRGCKMNLLAVAQSLHFWEVRKTLNMLDFLWVMVHQFKVAILKQKTHVWNWEIWVNLHNTFGKWKLNVLSLLLFVVIFCNSSLRNKVKISFRSFFNSFWFVFPYDFWPRLFVFNQIRRY